MNPVDTPAHPYADKRPSVNRLWDHDFLLFVEDLSVSFDGFRAVDIDALGIGHNELRVIVGPNGAGKTTLCDLISGKTPPDSGRVWFDAGDITRRREVDIARMGVGRKFQVPDVYDSLTVYENMVMALPGHQGLWHSLVKKPSDAERDEIMQLLARVNLADEADQFARYLSHGQRQWLAISSLILARPRLLLVDEPAAGLSDAETALTADLLLELRGEHTLIVIEHDMEFVRRLDSTVTVLNEGRVLAEGTLETIQQDEAVIQAYLGR